MNPDDATARGIVQNEGVLAYRASDCILCRTPGRALFARLRDEDGHAPGIWNLLACSACGLVWLDPRPLPVEIGKLYHGYYTHGPSDPWSGVLSTWGIRRGARSVLAAAFGYAHLARGKKRAAAGKVLSRIGLLTDLIGATVMWLPASRRGQLLDVGCGAGHFLARMRTLGWWVKGVEPDADAVRVARGSFGLNVHHGTLADAGFPDNEFDALTMNHVIEHVLDPIDLLRECRRTLKVGGRLIVVTPNAASLGRRWFGRAWSGWEPPRHLFLFTSRAFRICAERAGLSILTLRTTARLAPAIWIKSTELRRRARGGQVTMDRPGRGTLFASRATGLYEHVLGNHGRPGEELVLIATKD